MNAEIGAKFERLQQMDIPTCQLSCFEASLMTDDMAGLVKQAAQSYAIEITAFWCGWPPPRFWNFYEGPATLGLVPPAYRSGRLEILLHGSDFAKKLGISDLITHVGFIPENPNDPDYIGVVHALKHLVTRCQANDQYFLFETGQETPVTLKRVIEDIGLPNLGVNLDPANLLMYGKANPLDAIDLFGNLIRGVHAKDGEYPVGAKELGIETPLGEGRVNYPEFINKLKRLGYSGAITIEREIEGEEQIRDIITAKKLLESWIASD
ncbi:sugar phosphate isomerase/epimerase [Paenibacillus sp. PAMC21692]|nr:sugar phosphate isomerase/epimerase [Paenibacillus sp. PAMC21692]